MSQTDTSTAPALPAKGDRVFLPARFGQLAEYVGKVAHIEDDWAMIDLGDFGEIGCPVADLIREADRGGPATAGQ